MADSTTTIYILGNNSTGSCWYFADQALARRALAAKAQKCRYAFGVDCFKQEPDSFSYIFGWEEHLVAWRIKEVPIVTDLAQIAGAM